MNKRIKWLDFAKGFAIFFVVFAHILQSLRLFPFIAYVSFTFVMPVFFAISGYLYKKTDTIHKFIVLLYKKISGFIIPYVVFSIILIALWELKVKGQLTLYKYLFVPNTYLWFLYALFFIFIIVGFEDLIHIRLYVQFILSIILLILQRFLPWQQGPINVNPYAGIGGYLICFYIGIIMHKYNFTNHIKHIHFIPVYVIFWLILMYVQFILYPYDTDMFCFSDMFTKLTSIPLLFAIFVNIPSHNRLFNYLDKYGKYTLVIYLIHYPILDCFHKLLKSYVYIHSLILFPIFLIIIWELCIYTCYLSKNLPIISFIFYPKKYITRYVLKTKFGKKYL